MSSRRLWSKLRSLIRHSHLAFSQLCLPSRASQVPQLSRSFKKLAVRLLVILLWPFAYGLPPTTDGLANLEVMLLVVSSFGEQLPPICQGTRQEVWPVFMIRSWPSTARTMTAPSTSPMSFGMLSTFLWSSVDDCGRCPEENVCGFCIIRTVLLPLDCGQGSQ
jgi:hypothetical protein